MSGLIWYWHDELGTAVKQPESAQPFLAASGWFPMSEEDVTAREQAAADAVAADEQAMQAQAEKAAADAAEAQRAAAADAERSLALPDDADVPTATTEAAPPAETPTEENE